MFWSLFRYVIKSEAEASAVDTVGGRWTQLEASGHSWRPVDTVVGRWTQLEAGGHSWRPVDTV